MVFSWIILFRDEENDEEVAVLVAAAGVVHHWDGSLDGVASLWPSKEHVPADGTRFEQGFPRVAVDGTRSFIHPFALNGCV